MLQKKILPFVLAVLVSVPALQPSPALGEHSEDSQQEKQLEKKDEPEESDHSIGHRILFYIPDRVLDMFDIFRLRARVGPGVAVGVRATEVAQVYAGSYASVYAGLPGPRQRCLPRSPVGLESLSGVDVSVIEASVSGGIGPDYSPTEFGLGTQLAIIGFDFGVDPYEILDLVVGFAGFDLRDDDC